MRDEQSSQSIVLKREALNWQPSSFQSRVLSPEMKKGNKGLTEEGERVWSSLLASRRERKRRKRTRLNEEEEASKRLYVVQRRKNGKRPFFALENTVLEDATKQSKRACLHYYKQLLYASASNLSRKDLELFNDLLSPRCKLYVTFSFNNG